MCGSSTHKSSVPFLKVSHSWPVDQMPGSPDLLTGLFLTFSQPNEPLYPCNSPTVVLFLEYPQSYLCQSAGLSFKSGSCVKGIDSLSFYLFVFVFLFF